VAAFAKNDKTGHGFSSLTVRGDVVLQSGAAAVLGCEPNFFNCLDDPNQSMPSLQSRTTINGELIATKALGLLVHNSSIDGNLIQQGGGGGLTCTPQGIFAVFQSPVYSDYEDVNVGGSITINGMSSCWLGALRDSVGGSVTVTNNKFADPDANEILHNTVMHNLACSGNSPQVQYGDSGSAPNVVAGSASGECSFAVRKPNPSPNGPMSAVSIPVTSSVLPSMGTLAAGASLFSAGGQFRLQMQQRDGNLVLSNSTGQALWASRTTGWPGATAHMQRDGNFVIYSTGGRALWSTGTAGNDGAFAVMQTNGKFVIYSAGGKALWST
jgi:hypothetical protein